MTGGEGGTAPLELALGVAAILVPVALLVVSFAPWLERRAFVRLAAAEAARLVVVSGGDESRARELVFQVAANNGIGARSVRVSFCEEAPGTSPTCLADGRLPRGGDVTVRVEVDVPGVPTPFGTVGDTRAAHAHTEPVDAYRSLP